MVLVLGEELDLSRLHGALNWHPVAIPGWPQKAASVELLWFCGQGPATDRQACLPDRCY